VFASAARRTQTFEELLDFALRGLGARAKPAKPRR
jgi:hypothetical protein